MVVTEKSEQEWTVYWRGRITRDIGYSTVVAKDENWARIRFQETYPQCRIQTIIRKPNLRGVTE